MKLLSSTRIPTTLQLHPRIITTSIFVAGFSVSARLRVPAPRARTVGGVQHTVYRAFRGRVRGTERVCHRHAAFSGIAEFERDLIRERTGAGRVDARKRGVRFGRPTKMTDEQLKPARRLMKEGTPVREVARTFSVHPATLYRMVAPAA